MGYWVIDGKNYNDEEYEIYPRQEQAAEERLRLEAEELSRRLGETYRALGKLLRDNPNLRRQVRTDEEALHNEIYYKLLQNLKVADQAPRCRWVKKDGTLCRSPQLKNHVYCYAHWEMMQRRAQKISLPAVEDANAIQLAIIEVQRCLIDHRISEKEAGLLLYSLQIAAANVDRTTFGKASDAEMVRDIADEEDAMEAAMRQDPTKASGDPVTPPQTAQNTRGLGAPVIGRSGDPTPAHANPAWSAIPDFAGTEQSGSPGSGDPDNRTAYAVAPNETAEDRIAGKMLPQSVGENGIAAEPGRAAG